MRQFIVALDALGAAQDVGVPGVGFRVVPARAAGADVGTRPGSYPIRVKLNGGSTSYEVTSDDARVLREPFRWLALEGGESGDGWKVEIFEDYRERVDPPGARGSVPVRVQAPTAIGTAAPIAMEGIKVRPGTRTHTFYAGGTLAAARLWVRSAGGTWVDTLEDLDFVTSPVQTRVVYNSADRVYLKGSAGMTLEIDSECEVG